MIYFKQEDNKTKKYEVTFDEEQMLEFRETIVNNYSSIIHHEYNSIDVKRPHFKNGEIRNFSYRKVIFVQYGSIYSAKEGNYLIRYDTYEYPDMVNLIDRLLSKDIQVLDEIFDLKSRHEREKLAKKAIIELEKINDQNITKEEKMNKLNEIKRIVDMTIINDMLQSMLEFKTIDNSNSFVKTKK